MIESLKTVTWQEVALIAVLFSGCIAAHRFLGDGAAEGLSGLTTIVALLLGRKTDPQ